MSLANNAANYVTILGAGPEMLPSVCVTTSKVSDHFPPERRAHLWGGCAWVQDFSRALGVGVLCWCGVQGVDALAADVVCAGFQIAGGTPLCRPTQQPVHRDHAPGGPLAARLKRSLTYGSAQKVPAPADGVGSKCKNLTRRRKRGQLAAGVAPRAPGPKRLQGRRPGLSEASRVSARLLRSNMCIYAHLYTLH